MQRIECEGAPRDMGWDQGRACRDALRRAVGLLPGLPLLLRDARTRDVLQEIRRHFPQQYEQLLGMARGAQVAPARLATHSLGALCAPSQAVAYQTADGVHLAVSAPPDAIMRHARPEGRFATQELTRPMLTTSLLSLNERGLAVAMVGAPAPGARGASAALLLRDCVERFESVAAATEWCLTRPCAPGGRVLLADAAGDLAAVEIGPQGRQVSRPPEGSPEALARPFTATPGKGELAPFQG